MSKLIDNIETHELQFLAVRMPHHKLAKFLGVSEKELRKRNLPNSLKFLKGLQSQSLDALFLKFESLDAMAKHFSVSKAFLKSLRKEPDLGLYDNFSSIGLKEQLARIGSIPLLSMLWNVPESIIRKRMKVEKINNQDIVSLHETYFESSKGRVGELQFAKARGECILEDTNLKDPHANWDFKDKDLGKVNVKSSKAFSTKSGEWYYNFSLSSMSHSEHIAFMCFDDEFGHVVNWFVVAVANLKARGYTASFMFYEDIFSKIKFSKGYPEISYDDLPQINSNK